MSLCSGEASIFWLILMVLVKDSLDGEGNILVGNHRIQKFTPARAGQFLTSVGTVHGEWRIRVCIIS